MGCLRGRAIALAMVLWLGGSALSASTAEAYTTRVHIALANEIRRNVIAEGGGAIRLMGSGLVVQLTDEDSAAIMDEPLAFRAGAIGPDNLVFPAMTDGSHGVEQDPYRQCELLYQEALTRRERAYALGCFLHGATDAIAHHLVNAFTGETFTLTPISEARESSFDNVVGHIVTEATIQEALVTADESRFTAGQLEHDLPQDFILRTYFATESPVWQRLAEHPREKFAAARAADPDGNVLGWAQSAGLAAWEQIAMAPVYVDQVQLEREALRTFIDDELADLQDSSSTRGSELGVGAGSDGTLGTPDDTTACSVSCPSLAARYYVFVRIIQPRFDAAGRELPSAFDALSDGIGDQLYGFLPALVQVIANLSAQLNQPVTADGEHGLDLDASIVSTALQPIDDWADTLVATTESGFDDLAGTLTPSWYTDLSEFFQDLGVDITIGNIIQVIFGPILDQIRETLVDEVIGRAETYLNELTVQYRDQYDAWVAAVQDLLDDSEPPELGADALATPYESGMWRYSVDLTAAAFGNHEILLVDADPIGRGPASFDASYTHDWTQVGRCSYLRDAVFPQGTDLSALLSVFQGDTVYVSALGTNSPVECHDGSLSSFGDPSSTTCAHVGLDALLMTPVGSISRAYPPDHGPDADGCRNLTVPGLPEPPPPGPDAGTSDTDGAVPDFDGGPGTDPGDDDGGCGCATPGTGSGSSPWALIALFGLVLAFRRRGGAAVLAACLFLVACGDDDSTDSMVDASMGMDLSMMDDAAMPMDMNGADMPMTDMGPDPRREFLDALDGTVWHGMQMRDEGGVLKERMIEMHFDSTDLRWGEIVNPYGPGRVRILRTFNPMVDGTDVTVDSTIMIPTGWETPEPLRGQRGDWTFAIDGTELTITDNDTGFSEVFDEGAAPAPTSGLTADVRVFGSSGTVYDNFCGAGFGTWEDAPILDFARGSSAMLPLAQDLVAGAVLGEWVDGVGAFAVTDLDGFDRLGGTDLTQQANFVVRYVGTLPHTGHLSVREEDDSYEQLGSWVFTAGDVGSGSRNDALHEIFHFFGDDDEEVTEGSLPADEVEVEVVVVWCGGSGGEAYTLQQSLTSASGPWQTFGTGAIPRIDDTLFPPVL